MTRVKPVAKVQISGFDCGDAIRDKITPSMLETRDGRLMARELLRRANEFDNGTWTVEKLDLERSKLSKTFGRQGRTAKQRVRQDKTGREFRCRSCGE